MTCSKSRSRSRRRADAIAQAGYANGLGAVLAARRQRVDRAFEAVEGVGGTVHADLKCLVVVVSAGFASGHENPRNGCGFWGLEVITRPCRAGSGRFCVPM